MPSITPKRKPAPAWPSNIAEPDRAKLQSSGISAATAKANGLYSTASALKFPFRNLLGTTNGYAVTRPHDPGEGCKYLSPPGKQTRPYWSAATLEKLEDESVPLLITEGPIKALALSQAGYAAVGISGVNCGHVKGTTDLLPELAEVVRNRTIYIVFDADEKETTRKNVRLATEKLAASAMDAGAEEVRVVELPFGPGETKMGVDDFLVKYGTKAFAKLLKQAEPIQVIKIIKEQAVDVVREHSNNVIKIIPPVLGPAAYHGLIGEFLHAVAPYTEATDPGVLAHLLPAIGVAAGPAPHIFAGGPQPPRVNALLVGPTSKGRKGTAQVPVDMLMRESDSKWWQSQYASGLSSGEGLIQKVADKPARNSDDDADPEEVDKRLWVVEPEFSRVLANAKREGNVLSQIIRQAFDSGGKLSTLTVTPREADGAHISIVGHITPEELGAKFTDIDTANGFGNRFMYFYVESDKFLPFTEPFPPTLFAKFAKCIRAMIALGTHAEPFAVAMEPAAASLWEQVYEELSNDRPGLAGAVTARGPTMVLRTALIYCLFERWRSLDKRPRLSVEHLEAALAVWRYSEESAYQLFGAKRDRLADKLLQLLADGAMTKTDMNKHLSERQKGAVNDTLARLVKAGDIRTAKSTHKGAGRPATRYELTPSATSTRTV